MIKKRITIKEALEKFTADSSDEYLVYGRLFSKRQSSNFTFFDIQDNSAKIQVIIDKSEINDSFKSVILNPGDFYAVRGTIITTKSGEISVKAKVIEKISYASQSLPKNIKEPELIIRKRYLDLATNEKLRKTLELRSNLIFLMRKYFFNNGFIEADTPILQEKAIVGTAAPFVTRSKCLGRDLYLRGSCEIKLKQLIVGGYEKVFEIGPVFRNESESLIEFPLLEVEAAYHSYMDMALIVESMLKQVFYLLNITDIDNGDTKIDLLKKPWKKISVVDAIKTYYKEDLDIFDDIIVSQEIELLGLDFDTHDKHFKRAQLINFIIKKYIAKKLVEATFLINYPKQLSPLAIEDKNNPYFAERGYLYISGQRLCEIVSEENDPEKQKKSFAFQDTLYGISNHGHDDLIDALSYGCPPTGGIGLNINRLIVLLIGSDKLESTVFFPLSASSINK